MRIGIFTDTYYPLISGVVTSITTLEEELIRKGHEVYIFTTDLDKRLENKQNIHYFSGVKVPTEKLKSFRISFRLHTKVKEIKKYNLDIIHIQTEFSMAKLGVLAGKKYHIPVIYTLHTLYEDYLQYISRTIDRLFHKKFLHTLASFLIGPINKIAQIKIVPTRKVLAHVSKYSLSGDIRVVPTGLDFKCLTDKKVDADSLLVLKKELNIDPDSFIFLSIGRISDEKSLDKVIRAFSKIKDEPATLVIVGDGPAIMSLEKLSNELNISEDKIKFLGFIEWNNIVKYYQLGDLFVNASVTETQGLTYLESIICGTPLLVQKDECLLEVIKEGKNGFYFNGEDDLAVKMQYFLDHKTEVHALKNKTEETITKFTKEHFCDDILQIYKDGINKSKIKTHKFITGLKK